MGLVFAEKLREYIWNRFFNLIDHLCFYFFIILFSSIIVSEPYILGLLLLKYSLKSDLYSYRIYRTSACVFFSC